MDARRTTLYNLPPELAEHSQYEVLRELGRGGMGVVYLAKNKLMDRLEVLKVVNKALLDRPGSVERFLREIRSAAKLNHPNVVAAYSALQIGELLVFAMEYIEGEDLAALVKARGPLPVTHACHYVQQAAIGLQHAFEKGMVHRDIKPQNLILAREGKKHIVKVLDFGLAKATREKADDTALTGEGQMLGTPDFMAPEQTVDAARADIRADIYSLGCTLYFLLTGTPPFRGKSLGAVILAHQSTEARPLNLVRPEVSQELGAVVWKMMAKQPAQRYQTPAEVVQALAGAGKSAAKGAPPKSSPDVPAPATKGLSDEEKRLLRAETILPSPEAAQATMLAPGARPVGAGNILSAKTILPDQARQARVGRKPHSAAGKTLLIGAAVVAALLLLGLLGLAASRVFKKVNKRDATDDDPIQAASLNNFRFLRPDRPWKSDRDIELKLHVNLGMRSTERNNCMGLFFKDYKTRLPSEAEMVDEALGKLRSYLQGLEWELKPKEKVQLAGCPALLLEFQGEDPEHVQMHGECYLLKFRGYAYWFFTWGPLGDQELVSPEWDGLRERFSLLDGRKGWTEKPRVSEKVQGNKAKYQLNYVKELWTQKPLAKDYDPLADLVLQGAEPDPDRIKSSRKTAILLVLVLPPQKDLQAATAAAREYLQQREDKEYPKTSIQVMKDKNGAEIDRNTNLGNERGHLSKFLVQNTEDLERFMVMAVVNRPEGVLVLVGDCLWERRDFWDQEFTPLIDSLNIKDR